MLKPAAKHAVSSSAKLDGHCKKKKENHLQRTLKCQEPILGDLRESSVILCVYIFKLKARGTEVSYLNEGRDLNCKHAA